MKQRFFITIMVLMMSLSAMAQKGLQINSLFDGRYRKSPNAVEIVVTGKEANTIKLTTYRSLSLTDDADAVELMEKLVTEDGLTAVDKEVEYCGGKLYYGFYTLSPIKLGQNSKLNRYIFYLNQNLSRNNPVNKVTLIYMDGWAKADYIKGLIRK